MTTTAPFPHHYFVELDGAGFLSSGPRPPIPGGAPPQFGGSDRWWSPEELLVGAASLCLLNTFRALARRDSLEFSGYRCRGEGTLDRTSAGPAFRSIAVSVHVTVAAPDLDRAERLLAMAKKRCIISNTLSCPVELEAWVAAAPAAA